MSLKKFAWPAGLASIFVLVMALFATSTSAEVSVVSVEGPHLVSWNGVEVGNDVSTTPYRSANLVAFTSQATNLDGDVNIVNEGNDIYVADGSGVHLITRFGDRDANGTSASPVVSENEGCLVFKSSSTELVSGVGGSYGNIFVYNLSTGDFELVSRGYDGSQTNGHSRRPFVSADCRYVAFTSSASNLVQGDSNSEDDVFRVDTWLPVGAPGRVVRIMGAEEPNGLSYVVDMSADGSKLALMSYANNLTSEDSPYMDLFVAEIGSTGTVSIDWVSSTTWGGPGDGGVLDARLSSNGRFAVFSTLADNMTSFDGPYADVFVRDLTTNQLYLVSHDRLGGEGNNESGLNGLDVTDCGDVVYNSRAYDLVQGVSGFAYRLYFWQFASNTNFLLEDLEVWYPVVNGDQVSFFTFTGVVPEDNNNMADVYNLSFDIQAIEPTPTPEPTPEPTPTPEVWIYFPIVFQSGDGN